jgi:hypothetical protein
MAGDEKTGGPWQWLKDNKDQLASITYLVTLTSIIGGVLIAVVKFASPYSAAIGRGLGIAFLAFGTVAMIWDMIKRWRDYAATNYFAAWTRFVLTLCPILLLQWALHRNTALQDHALINPSAASHTPETYIMAYGTLAWQIIAALLLLIWFARFYWSTHVRLMLLEAIARKNGIDPEAARKRLFDMPEWRPYRDRKWTLLQVAAPTDLAYIEPTTPTGPPLSHNGDGASGTT